MAQHVQLIQAEVSKLFLDLSIEFCHIRVLKQCKCIKNTKKSKHLYSEIACRLNRQ